MYTLCGKIRGLTPYTPITGEYAIRLDANESCFTPPGWLLDKIRNAVASVAFNRYPDPYATGVCRAFADYYGGSPELVTAGNGSDELISVIVACLLESGDPVLTLLPDFSMYAFYTELYEKRPVTLCKNEDLCLSADDILCAASGCGAKAILLSNPCNPTGQGLPAAEVRRLIRGTGALVVLDEAYMDFWDQSLLREAADYDNLIILRTCSKALGMAALRLGFAVANPTLTRALRAAKSPYNVNGVTQAIGQAVLEEKDYLHGISARLTAQRERLAAELTVLNNQMDCGWRIYPSKTNFVLIKTGDSRGIYERLLKKGVAVRCLGDCLRVTAPSPEELPVFLDILAGILERP